MAALRFGLVYDLLGSYPRGLSDPDDVDTEFEPEATACALEAADCYRAQLLAKTAHFRVSIERGVEIFRALRCHTSGCAISQYVLDTSYGKVPFSHRYFRVRKR